MTVVANLRNGLSPRAAAGTRQGARPDVVRPTHRPARRVAHTDGRRPARLVTAPHLVDAQSCEPHTAPRSIGWLLLVGVLACLAVVGLGWALFGGPDTSSAAPTRTVVVQVHQGETLWNVAQRLAPSAQPATEVAAIRKLNGLDVDSTLYPGELLQVPSNLSDDAAAKAGAIQH